MGTKALSKSDRIRVLNDNFRTTFCGGCVVTTAGVSLALGHQSSAYPGGSVLQ